MRMSLKSVPKDPKTIWQHWSRQWLGADHATTYYLNQWWHSFLTHICVSRPRWVDYASSLYPYSASGWVPTTFRFNVDDSYSIHILFKHGPKHTKTNRTNELKITLHISHSHSITDWLGQATIKKANAHNPTPIRNYSLHLLNDLDIPSRRIILLD